MPDIIQFQNSLSYAAFTFWLSIKEKNLVFVKYWIYWIIFWLNDIDFVYKYIYIIHIILYYIVSSDYVLQIIAFDVEKQSNICNCLTDCKKNQ